MIVIGRPVDTTELEKYAPPGFPLPPIYPGSIISRCDACTVDVYVGPRGQDVLKQNPDVLVLCPICGIIKPAQTGVTPPTMHSLGNPYRPAADEPQGVFCPGCGEPAAGVMAGLGQAMCGNDDCHVLMWNPAKTLEELAEDIHQVDARKLFGPDVPRD